MNRKPHLTPSPEYRTEQDISIPAVTAEQMLTVDRVAMNDFGLGILQMMGNAGRSLAETAMDMLNTTSGEVVILAGARGNGGGGLCCARHLHTRGFRIGLVLDRDAAELSEAATTQWHIL